MDWFHLITAFLHIRILSRNNILIYSGHFFKKGKNKVYFTSLNVLITLRFPCHLDIISRLGYNNSGGRISAKMFAAPRHAADKWPGQNVCRSPICG
jgi:hypothetical protein